MFAFLVLFLPFKGTTICPCGAQLATTPSVDRGEVGRAPVFFGKVSWSGGGGEHVPIAACEAHIPSLKVHWPRVVSWSQAGSLSVQSTRALPWNFPLWVRPAKTA